VDVRLFSAIGIYAPAVVAGGAAFFVLEPAP